MRVAALIHETKLLHLPLNATVREVMEVSEKKAAYMIRRVKDAGLVLTKTKHRPAGTIVNRGTPGEFRLNLCQFCLGPWPCRPYLRQLRELHGDAVMHHIMPEQFEDRGDTDDDDAPERG